MRLKNYSINTIRTYHQMLMKYLNSFDSDIEIINSYTEQEINKEARIKHDFTFTVCGTRKSTPMKIGATHL